MENNEENKPQGNEQTEAKEDNDDGLQSKTISELDRADQIAERQKRENDRREELLKREEALEARKRVGGIAEAGQKAPTPKPISDEEYSEKFLKGEVNPFKEDGIK